MFKNKEKYLSKKNIKRKIKIKLIKKKEISKESIGYITSILACASIPHSNIKDSYFKRSNGQTSLKIISDPEYGLPYGLIPRILMIWICTQAKLTNSHILYLGKNQNEFIKQLGITPTGGKNGSINRVRKQTIKLLHSTISLTYDQNNTHKFNNLTIVDKCTLFYGNKKSNNIFWKSNITLSDKFYREIKNTSLPIDLNVVKSMRSPLAIDIYIWLTWRTRIIKNKNGILISWSNLKLQFGSNYCNSNKGLLNFKKEFIKRLKYVCFFYPQVNVTVLSFGIKLKKSYPHISCVN